MLVLATISLQANAQNYCNFNNCLFWQIESPTVLGDTVNYATNQWSIDEWDNIACNFPVQQCENLGLEVYYPATLQPTEKRPLVMLIHGGGFIGGSRADFRQQAITIAQLGYVTATIDYRLCKRNNCLLLLANPALLCNLNWGSDFAQSAYVAAHDGNSAISFLKQNAEAYHIDTNNIIIGGHSAGALTAMLMGFTDQAEANTLGGFEGTWGNINKQQGIKGVFSLSGAAFDTTFIDANEDIPTFIVHGTCDPVVCYGTDAAFHCGNSYPDIYGGADIATRMHNLNHNYYLYTGKDMGHDVGALASNWLVELLYFIRKNVLCAGPIQKHVVADLNPDSGECATLEGNVLQTPHTRYSPASLTQTAAFGNFPPPCTLTTIGEEEKLADITIFPNPAQDFFTIDAPTLAGAQFELYDIAGRKLQQQTITANQQQVNVSNLVQGVYVYTITYKGQIVKREKVIISR